MSSSYSDYIVSKDCSKKKRYTFRMGVCSWCGKDKWLPAEGVCGYCYEDEARIRAEKAKAQAKKEAK